MKCVVVLSARSVHKELGGRVLYRSDPVAGFGGCWGQLEGRKCKNGGATGADVVYILSTFQPMSSEGVISKLAQWGPEQRPGRNRI